MNKLIIGFVILFFISCGSNEVKVIERDTTELRKVLKSGAINYGFSFSAGTHSQKSTELRITVNDVKGFDLSNEDSCRKYANLVLDHYFDDWKDKNYTLLKVVFISSTHEQEMGGSFSEVLTGMAYYQSDKDYKKALKYANQLLSTSPKDADYIALRGFVYAQGSKMDLAINDLQNAMAINPEKVEFKMDLAKAYELDSQFVKSEEILQQVIDKDFQNDQALIELAYTKQNLNKNEESIKLLNDVSSTYEDRNVIQRLKAKAYSKLGKNDSANSIIVNVLKLDSSAVTFRTLGEIRLEQKKNKEACQYLMKASSMGDDLATKLLTKNCK